MPVNMPVNAASPTERLRDDDAGLNVLVSRLNRDAAQLVHDEIHLAKLEMRDIADALSDDVRDAGRTVVRDITAVGIVLLLGFLGGLALVGGAVLALGRMFGGAYWASAFVAGAVLIAFAVVAHRKAARDRAAGDPFGFDHTLREFRQLRDFHGGGRDDAMGYPPN